MTSTRTTAITTGTLLVVATVAALVAARLTPPLAGTDYLAGVAAHPHRLAAAAVCYLIAAGTSAGIAIAPYPLLRRVGPGLALGSVAFRTVEAVLYTTAVVALLTVRPVARRFAAGPVPPGAEPVTTGTELQELADALLAIRDYATLTGVFAFCAGASMYYALLYRSRLVPRWLSAWGMAGAALMTTACLLALFADRPVTGYTPLILPILVQELVLAGWLLVRGFRVDTP